MNEKLVVIISASAVFNLTLVALLSWFKSFKRTSYFWLGWMFLATCVAILDNTFIFIHKGSIILYHLALFLNVSWGAYLILFVKCLHAPEKHTISFNWKLFIPSILYFLFLVLSIFLPNLAQNTFIASEQHKMSLVGLICNLTICLYSMVSNIVLLWKESVNKGNNLKIKELLWVMLILQLMAFVPFVFKFDLDYILLYMPVFGQIFFLYIFFRLTQSNHLFQDTESSILLNNELATKYAAIRINDEKATAICSRIMNLMETEKPYLRMEYTLPEMARELNILPNTLSMILNSKLNSSFPDYINSMRVKTAIYLLNDFYKRNLTIETIAYESGFNNRTSFYQAFKKQTGKLPKDYVQKRI